MKFSYQKFNSPIGMLFLVAKDDALCGLYFQNAWPQPPEKFSVLTEEETPVLAAAKKQLTEYFSGERQAFDLPLVFQGTDFQERVWRALQKIPFGETRTYREQAVAIKSPRAQRAVGRADGLNPIGIIVPCHRVIGSNGRLTGFGGGLQAKRFLLTLEGAAFSE